MLTLVAAAAALAQQSSASPYPQRPQQRPIAPRVVTPVTPPQASVEAQGSDQPIQTIVFEGAEAPTRVAEAAQAFVGRPATRANLIELAGALSRAYEKTDVALYTVSIPTQDSTDGVVTVELVEGWVDRVQVKSPANERFPLLERIANKMVGEKPLTRSRYERQASLMQGLPGMQLEQSVENPEGDDSVELIVTPKQRRAAVAFGINNRGPNLLGDLVLNAGLDLYRLAMDGDQLSFTAAATPKPKHYRAAEASYAMPIGADGLRLTASGAWVGTKAKTIDIRGEAKFAALNLSYPILRRAKDAADISIGIDGVDSDNALFGNIFATEKTRAMRASAVYASASERHNLTANAIASQGLDILGAEVAEPNGEAGFTKLSGGATFEQLLVPRLLGRINATGQLSGDRLPAAELFSIGGPTIGRAFDTGILTGDRGIGGFVELAFRPVSAADFQKSELYLFGDAATLTIEERGLIPQQSFSLASAGAGVRMRWKDRIQLGLEAAKVVDRPFDSYEDDWRASFYYSILL
jgi:hemolysin activation/secretion protein